uniref:ATPase, AAA-type, core, P-loop containing nucleoside triphosphate hydrolase n=1 Tax=Tanacetum cinerariifolium TaxID=118510 RepID=A0A6L2MBM1_TANCI|nr:ATPase, AAA-type, core, P-loop containing nucleoside triphosphate hydrolase [Tanacetum cinerariifolium]
MHVVSFGTIEVCLARHFKVGFLGFVSLLHLISHKTEPINVSFNELLGVDDIIHEFQDIISILHGKSEHKNFRSKLPIGVFLYGPPGTGKCTLAHAMAREANVPFFCLSACYIRRGDTRLQLQTEMEKCNKDGIMVMVKAATDSPETLDSTFMSSCQIYKTFHVAKPDEDSRRKKANFCFKDHIKKEDKEAICNLVASQTSGLKWAHLENLVVESRVAAKYRRGGGHVTIDDVREAIRGYDNFITIMKMTELHNNPCDSLDLKSSLAIPFGLSNTPTMAYTWYAWNQLSVIEAI